MPIAFGAGAVLAGSLAAFGSLIGLFGLWRYPRAATWMSAGGAIVACITIAIQLVAPIVAQVPVGALPGIWTYYFLAMANSFNPEVAYPFFWSAEWTYRIGTLTPLVAVGAAMALAFGLVARRTGGRAVLASIVIGLAAIAGYVALAAMAARDTWLGVPV